LSHKLQPISNLPTRENTLLLSDTGEKEIEKTGLKLTEHYWKNPAEEKSEVTSNTTLRYFRSRLNSFLLLWTILFIHFGLSKYMAGLSDWLHTSQRDLKNNPRTSPTDVGLIQCFSANEQCNS